MPVSEWYEEMAWDRRQILLFLAFATTMPIWHLGRASGQSANTPLEVSWYVHRDNLPALVEKLHWTGQVNPYGELSDTKGLPIVYVLVGVAALPYIADAIIALYKKTQYGAIIVDATEKKLQITNDTRIDGGKIILRTKDSLQVLDQNQIRSPKDIMEALAPLLEDKK